MDAATVRFSFAFRCLSEGAQSVVVRYAVANRAAGSPPLRDIGLRESTPSAFVGEQKIAVRAPDEVDIRFSAAFADGHRYESESLVYRLDDIPNDLIVISASERTDSPPTVTLRFKLQYRTVYGQNVFIVGSLPELDVWDVRRGAPMTHAGLPQGSANGIFTDARFNWQMDLVLPAAPATLSYRYVVKSEGSPPRIEGGGLRYFAFPSGHGPANYEFNDTWRWEELVQNVVVKRMFDDTFGGSRVAFPAIGLPIAAATRVVFLAFSTRMPKARSLYIVGSIPQLGMWKPHSGVPMASSSNLLAMAAVDLPKASFPFEYKHVVLGENHMILWEPNDNRRATVSNWMDEAIPWVVIVDSWHLSFADVAFHGAGVFVKLNAVRDRGRFVDFASLKRIAEWAGAVGFAAVHFVGLFDTTGLRPAFQELPVSGFAINPFWLDLRPFGIDVTGEDGSAVLQQKFDFLRGYWDGQRRKPNPDIKKFVDENRFWLADYEAFCAHEDPGFVDFVQFLCYLQLADALGSARERNVSIGMDLPFALYEHSAETLRNPDLFITDYRLGIAPTKSNPLGTLLHAFPYNFGHAAQWFARRVEHFGSMFDLIRIENTNNFFRQWIVPLSSVRAVFGRFDPCTGISAGELDTWGLWDIDRYTQPYIRPPILRELFGDDAPQIEAAFLESRGSRLVFQARFDTEFKLVHEALPADQEALRGRHLDGLLTLLNDVLLIKIGEDDYHPRLHLNLAPCGKSCESFSFRELPFHQSQFLRIHDEFLFAKQKCRWASNGRHNLRGIGGRTGALVLSDATGVDGEVCDEALQGVGILPFRVHLEGRSSTNNFDDIRNYPYFSIAAPTKDLSCSLRGLWRTKSLKRTKMWEDELFEKGGPPEEYNDLVAESMMRLHCWSGSMWVMFPLDSLIGAAGHMVGDSEVIELQLVSDDHRANSEIARVLAISKRKM